MKTTLETQTVRYDAHCHIISREVFFDRMVILLVNASKSFDLKKLVQIESTIKSEQEKSDRLHILKLIELLLENKTGKQTFDDLRNAYMEMDPRVQKFLPLMVDFEYIFRIKYYSSDETPKDKAKQKEHQAAMLQSFEDVRTKIKKTLKKEQPNTDKDKHRLLTRFVSETEDFGRPESKKAIDGHSIEIIKPYERQLETFKELKQEYKDDFQAFLATDPRRPGMMDLIMENVGQGKPFTGIKLYPPMGYSPTDPFLFGTDDNEDCLYKYCIDKQIPIITHCSAAGFSTFVDKLQVIGAVMPNMKFDSQPVIYTRLTEIKFETNILNFGKAVEERAYKLNHPKLWEIVLKKFPTLKIDLAHFGGDPDEYGTERREYIFKLMTQKQENGQLQYPYLYTDLSCITDKELLQDIYDNKFNYIKDRVMYGSDYFLNLIWGEDFATYYQNFTDVFNGEMDRIAVGNVEGFLGGALNV
jgi:predicted TIM-barrel fold metal-dependent hydrolase